MTVSGWLDFQELVVGVHYPFHKAIRKAKASLTFSINVRCGCDALATNTSVLLATVLIAGERGDVMGLWEPLNFGWMRY